MAQKNSLTILTKDVVDVSNQTVTVTVPVERKLTNGNLTISTVSADTNILKF